VKSDRSVVVLHHFGVGRTIGFQAAVSDTSDGKHPESSHQLIVRSRCLRRIVTQTKQVSGIIVSGPRVLTKDRIAPVRVATAAGESIQKPP